MNDEPALVVALWDPNGSPVGQISDAQSVSVSWRHNAVDTASVTVPIAHPLADRLADVQGVTLSVIDYEGIRFCGWCIAAQSSGSSLVDEATGAVTATGTRTATLASDWTLVTAMLAVPVPTAPISNQSGAVRDNRTGSIELVVKGLVRENGARLALPIYVMPVRNGGVGDGPTVSVSARMQPMRDVLAPVLAGANWRITTRTWLPGEPQPAPGANLQRPTVVVDVVATRADSSLLWSASTGSLLSWQDQTNAAGWDRSIVGGAGEDASRTFTEVVDSERAAVGGAWRAAESFVDARDIQGNDTMASLVQRGADNNATGAPTSAISLTVRDGAPWRLAAEGDDSYMPGDTATADIFGNVFTNRISVVTVTEDRGKLSITPTIGEPNTSATSDASLLKAITRLQTMLSLRAGS